MKEQNKLIALGVVAVIAIVILVLLIQNAITGKFYYRTPEEACATYTMMCNDRLPPIPTGRVDVAGGLVECTCQTNPYRTGWRSLVLTYGRVSLG